MKPPWIASVLVRAAALLVPDEERCEWVREWRSELWYMPSDAAVNASIGSFRDALWMRRHTRPASHGPLASPARCLLLLAIAALAGWFAALRLIKTLATHTKAWRLGPTDLFAACAITLVLSLALTVMIAAFGSSPPWRTGLPRSSSARRWLFFLLKMAAVQPAIVCGLFVHILLAPSVPVASLAIFAGWCLILRCVVNDQRERCPECLTLLSRPVRIGSHAATFLEWHGEESMCQHGHGLLHTRCPHADSRWLQLDASWHELFGTRA